MAGFLTDLSLRVSKRLKNFWKTFLLPSFRGPNPLPVWRVRNASWDRSSAGWSGLSDVGHFSAVFLAQFNDWWKHFFSTRGIVRDSMSLFWWRKRIRQSLYSCVNSSGCPLHHVVKITATIGSHPEVTNKGRETNTTWLVESRKGSSSYL